MLGKPQRITKKKEFDLIFAQGFSSHDKLLLVKVMKNKFIFPRFGIIVSAKVSKSAVARNKIKRQLRQINKLHNERIKPFDVVILVRPPAIKADYHELKSSLSGHYSRLRILK